MTTSNQSETTNSRTAALAGVAVAAAALGSPATGRAGEQEDKFLAAIKGDDAEARKAAWLSADQMDPQVIPALSALQVSKNPAVRKAAAEALNHVVHSVGKELDPAALRANRGRPNAPDERNKRQRVVQALLGLLDGKRHEEEKVTALRHLSLVADTDSVAPIAKLVHDEKLREEVVFCLERIPGKVSEEALLAALGGASDDFKPRILAALGHRQADEAMGACLEAMKSSDATIAVAGMKAAARIGAPVAGDIQLPDYDSLSDWRKIEYDDSLLRYADALLARGDADHASGLYRRALDREEGHLQCAAVIGLAKIGTAEAAAAIHPKLSSDNNTVRITAQKAWGAMSKHAAG